MRIGIIGAGIAGLSSAWALCKEGHSVTVFEQNEIPNPYAASGDEHRLIRRGYGRQQGYARRIGEAFDAWDQMFDDLGVRHYAETGILAVCQFSGDEGDEYCKGYEEAGIAHQKLSPAETEARYPFLDGRTMSYASLAPEGGVLFSKRIADDLLRWLSVHGVDLRPMSKVHALDVATGKVLLEAEQLTFDRLVVTAGAWVTELLPDLSSLLTPYRTCVVYLTPPAEFKAAWALAPGFISVGGTKVDGYILPPVQGTGLKFGGGINKVKAAPDLYRDVCEGEGERLRNHFSPPFHMIDRYDVDHARSCVYTFTSDEHFFAQNRGRALIVSACSGHGYKFGAALGRRLARALALGDEAGFIHWLEARD